MGRVPVRASLFRGHRKALKMHVHCENNEL
jgi:hypothetical protein